MSSDSTPLDPAPLDPAPLDSTPLDSTPLDSTPLDPAPLDSTPPDPAPLDSTPLDTTPLPKSYLTVMGKQMAYYESGLGSSASPRADSSADASSARSVVFLHGNPTSSYLWRNIIPHVRPHARCIAPDLIGHGDSDKLDDTSPGTYSFTEHRRYLDGLLDQLNLGDDVVLVIHDWGSALGFDWANRHRDRVGGIVFMEAIVQPFASWDEFPAAARDIFQAFRTEAGEQMVIERNLFVEAVLPGSILRTLSDEELDEYRRPFTVPEHRRPTLTWPRQIPIEGQPADVTEIVRSYAQWLPTTSMPKLFVNADPGALLGHPGRSFCRTWPNLTEVTVKGSHFIQEDSPHQIGQAISHWLADL